MKLIFTVPEKYLKSASERKLPIYQPENLKSIQVYSLPKGIAEIGTGMAEKSSPGIRKADRRNGV